MIDLKRGQVVHAVAGQRDQYAPLRSQLVSSFHPGRVATALTDRTANADVYVADLDAIAGDPLDWNSYELITNTGARPWIDAGANSVQSIQRLVDRVAGIGQVIIGLESLGSLRNIEPILQEIDNQVITFSLDLKDGLPFTSDSAAARMSAESIAAYVIQEGVQSLIVLDLIHVGSATGGASVVDLCRKIRARHLDIQLISGGGVRDMSDVERFIDAGCDRVLTATALHNGSI